MKQIMKGRSVSENMEDRLEYFSFYSSRSISHHIFLQIQNITCKYTESDHDKGPDEGAGTVLKDLGMTCCLWKGDYGSMNAHQFTWVKTNPHIFFNA